LRFLYGRRRIADPDGGGAAEKFNKLTQESENNAKEVPFDAISCVFI